MANLLGAFYSGWETWQIVLAIVLVVFAAVLLVYIAMAFFVYSARAEKSGRHLDWYEKQIAVQKKSLEAENVQNKAELEKNRQELKEKEAAIKDAEQKAAAAKEQLHKNEEVIRKLVLDTEISKKELDEYQKREKTHVSEDIAVNALTDKALAESNVVVRMIDGCKIPDGKILDFTAKEVMDYLGTKPKITFINVVGQKPAYYRIEKKNLAFVYVLPNDKVRLTFKCGPAYGAKLCKNLPQNVTVAKFPYGLTWFTVSNENAPCPLEVFQALVDISYKIARLGY